MMILSIFDFNFLSIILNSCLNVVVVFELYSFNLIFIIVFSIGSFIFMSSKAGEAFIRGVITGAGIAIGKQGLDAIISGVKSGNTSGDDPKSNPKSSSNPDTGGNISSESSSGDNK